MKNDEDALCRKLLTLACLRLSRKTTMGNALNEPDDVEMGGQESGIPSISTKVVLSQGSPLKRIFLPGDHRQTPGGLKNTVECRLFRQKLLQRPLTLRCGTKYVQPHEMCRIVNRYLDGPWDSPLKQLLENDDPSNSEHITAVIVVQNLRQ